MWNSNCGRGWGCFGGWYTVLTLTASHSYIEAAVDRWSVEAWEIAQTHTHSLAHTYIHTSPSLYTSVHHPTHCNPFIIAPWCRDQSWGQGYGIWICVCVMGKQHRMHKVKWSRCHIAGFWSGAQPRTLNVSVYGVLVTGSEVDTLSPSDEKHCKVMWRHFSQCPCWGGGEGREEEMIGWMEVAEYCTLDKCYSEAYVSHAQLLLHHSFMSKDLSPAACCPEREKEREGGANVKEKVSMESRRAMDPGEIVIRRDRDWAKKSFFHLPADSYAASAGRRDSGRV